MTTPTRDPLDVVRDTLAELRADHGRPAQPGCSLTAHDALGFCAPCAGRDGAGREIVGWRLLWMLAGRDGRAAPDPAPSTA